MSGKGKYAEKKLAAAAEIQRKFTAQLLKLRAGLATKTLSDSVNE